MGKRAVLVACAASVVVVCCVSGVASAESEPGWFSGHSTSEKQAIVDYAYVRAAQPSVPYSGEAATLGEAVAQDAVEAGSHEFPLAPELGAEELSVGESTSLLPLLGTIAPELFVAAGTFTVGVAIGTGLRKLFGTLTAPEEANSGGSGRWTWNGVIWRLYGTEIFFGADVVQRPGAYLYTGGYNGSTFLIVRWFEEPCDFSGFAPPSSAHMQTHLSTTATCREFNGREFVEYPVFVDYPYLTDADIAPVRPLRPFNSETDHPTYTHEAAPDPGSRAVESSLAVLDDASHMLLREEIDWALTPGSQEDEEPARVGTRVEPRDRECKEYFGDAPGSDPGARSPEAPEEAADWDFDVESFEEVFNPGTRSSQTVKLRWGTKSWGYRHIVMRHGWNAEAARRTALALQTDRSPTVAPRDTTGESWVYLYAIPGLPEGMRCRQRVVVSYRRDTAVPVGRHVITSYVQAY